MMNERYVRFLKAMFEFDETRNNSAAHALARAELQSARAALQEGDLPEPRPGEFISAKALAEL